VQALRREGGRARLTSSVTHDRSVVLALLRAHGWNATSFQVLERGFSYWLDPGASACVAFVDTGTAWVAAGAPVAGADDLPGTTSRFIAAARAARRRVCFFAVEDRFLAATAGELASMPIGEQPSWDPSGWSDVVAADPRLREQLRRSRAKGVSVRPISADELAQEHGAMRPRIEEIIEGWLETRKMAPMGFMVDVQPFDFATERRCFAAERGGELVGLLVAVPVYQRQGWLFEDLLRTPAAPNGTTELLVDAAMRGVAREGSRYVTLGLAPLAGGVEGWLRACRELGKALYDFDGIRRFKAKLRPDGWTPIHLAWPRPGSGNVALFDALGAFTIRSADGHDRASFVRFGLETLAHAPTFAVRVLSVLLVPWTLALALAPTAHFFPSRAVQNAWVLFDIVLAAAMLALGFRWRLGLARMLAVATLLDATLTILEVLVDGFHRVHGPAGVLVLVVAGAGPLLATSLLWGAVVRKTRPPRRGSAPDDGP
jgi:phosphatidylglycerol lysyltransferase